MNLRTENAIIKSADIVLGDYAMEMRVVLEGKGWGAVFGGISIGCHSHPKANLESSKGNYAAYYIGSILVATERESVSKLSGTPVRAIFDGSSCVGIMNFLDNTKLFIPKMLNKDFNMEDLQSVMDKYEYARFIKEDEK